jgi:hypothetical protein
MLTRAVFAGAQEMRSAEGMAGGDVRGEGRKDSGGKNAVKKRSRSRYREVEFDGIGEITGVF